MSTTIRVSEHTRRRVAELAAATGRQMQTIVDEAVADYERTMFWESFEAGYAKIADDPHQWSSVQAERDSEEAALVDDIR